MPAIEEEDTLDEALRQYQIDIAKATISRRRFMTGAAIAHTPSTNSANVRA